MIEFRRGDILRADAEALVNTVNCVGIMGRGIALQFKNAFPKNFRVYAAACKAKLVQPGKMLVVELDDLTGPRVVINFPTKRHWKGKSRLIDIEEGLVDLRRVIADLGLKSIAVPPLGCGLGGLDWRDVRPLVERALSSLDVRVLVYEPDAAPAPEAMTRSRDVPKMTPGRAALVGLVRRYLGGLMDPSVSLLEVHKLMYFMQQAGEELRLKYVKGPFGPYSENLRHVLRQVEGHLLSGYADGGDAPMKQLSLVPGAIEDAQTYLVEHPETRLRFDRVADLVDGFETAYGLELLATVHWVAGGANVSQQDIIAGVHGWNARKQMFGIDQIRLATSTLSEKGWL